MVMGYYGTFPGFGEDIFQSVIQPGYRTDAHRGTVAIALVRLWRWRLCPPPEAAAIPGARIILEVFAEFVQERDFMQNAVGQGNGVDRIIGENTLLIEQIEVLAFDPGMFET
jgi:hypothetical protein